MELMDPKVVIQPVIIKNEKFTTNYPTTAVQEMDSLINFNNEYRIPIKRSVLYKRCTFFTSMNNFKETNAKEIDIYYNADVKVFQALVDYIHTGKIELTTGNLEPVIRAAIYFQLDDLLKLCCNVLIQNTDHQTLGNVYNFAKELALIELRKAVVDLEAKHFHKIVKSKVFYEWLAERMLELLSSDEVEVSHEKKILKFVLDWLNVDPNERGEHAADIFRKLRFSYLNKKDMEEVVEGNSSEKLGQILQQVASEFSNQITPPRIYHKGIYVFGFTPTYDDLFVRYCPDDGSIMNLKTPNLRNMVDFVVNNDDIYLVRISPDSSNAAWNIHAEKYDAKKDTWTSRASTAIENVSMIHHLSVSVCQEKIFVFIKAVFIDDNGMREELNFCMMNCIQTNTWSRLSATEGNPIASSTACGDGIYMIKSTNLLQYKPSTGEFIDIPCQYRLQPWIHSAIAYKSNILFLPRSPSLLKRMAAVLFNTDTRDFRLYDFTETFKTIGINYSNLYFALFKDSVYVFTWKAEKVFKLDLSFIDEMKEPSLIPLPDIIGMKRDYWNIVSIQ